MNVAEIDKLVVTLTGESEGLSRVVKSAVAEMKAASGQVSAAAAESEIRFNSAGRAIDKYGRYVKLASGEMKGMTISLEEANQHIMRMGAGISSLGRKMSLMVTGPLTVIAGFGVRSFAQFDKAIVESTAIMGDLDDATVAAMKSQARELSDNGVKSARELADSYYFLASAGLSAEASIAALPAVQRFATAGAFDMKLATDLLTDAQSALGMSVKDPNKNLEQMIKLSDRLVKAATLANTSVQQISESLTNDAATASQEFGMELETTLAILDKYGDKGKKGAEAGSLLGRATRLMAGAYNENQAAFEKHNIAVTDAQGNYSNFIDIIDDLTKATKSMSESERAAMLTELGFAALAQKSITPLLGQADAMREYEKSLKNATDFTKDVAEKQLQSFSAQMSIVWNQITNVASEIGEILAPEIEWLGDVIKSGIELWKGLSEQTKRFIVFAGGIIAGIGPVLVVIGGLITAVGAVVAAISSLIAFGPAVMAFLGAIIAPAAIIIAKFTAVAAAIGVAAYALIGPDGFASGWEWVKTAAVDAFTFISGFIANFSKNMQLLTTWISVNWGNLFSDIGQLIILFGATMVHTVYTAIKTTGRLFNAWSGFIAGIFESIFTVEFLEWIIEGIIKASSLLMDFAHGAWKALMSIFKGDKEKITLDDFMDQMVIDHNAGKTDILGATKDILKDGLSELGAPIKNFKSNLSNLPAFVLTTGEEISTSLADGIKSGADQVADAAKDMADGIQAPLSAMEKAIEEMTAKWDFEGKTIGKTSREIEIYKLELKGATESQLNLLREEDKKLTALEKEHKLIEDGKRLMEEFQTPIEKYVSRQQELQELLDAGAIDQDTYNKALEKARETVDKGFDVKFNVSGIDAIEAGSTEAMSAIAEFNAMKNVIGPALKNATPVMVPPPSIAPNGALAMTAKSQQQSGSGLSTREEMIVSLLKEIAVNTASEEERQYIKLSKANLNGSSSS